jgi:hypothetical protein
MCQKEGTQRSLSDSLNLLHGIAKAEFRCCKIHAVTPSPSVGPIAEENWHPLSKMVKQKEFFLPQSFYFIQAFQQAG